MIQISKGKEQAIFRGNKNNQVTYAISPAISKMQVKQQQILFDYHQIAEINNLRRAGNLCYHYGKIQTKLRIN